MAVKSEFAKEKTAQDGSYDDAIIQRTMRRVE